MATVVAGGAAVVGDRVVGVVDTGEYTALKPDLTTDESVVKTRNISFPLLKTGSGVEVPQNSSISGYVSSTPS